MLCWKGFEAFENALQTYQAGGLFQHFDEKHVWFQEIDDEARELAARFDLPCAGGAENLGILGGFKALAQSMTSDVLLLLENDLPLIAAPQEIAAQLAMGQQAVATGEVVVFRYRSVRHPGQKFETLKKYQRYHGPGAAAFLRRLIRPGKARRLCGSALYAEQNPEEKFPEKIKRAAGGWLSVDASCLPWTNQSIMVRRDFFLDTIIAYAQENPSSRVVNGFPDIEKEWNNAKWRKSGWKIGAADGLFTHERV